MNINEWLSKFKSSWESKNISDILSLFSSDVIYYETPFHKLSGLDEVNKEWEAIKNQHEINLTYSIFSEDVNKYTVKWDLRYSNSEKNQFHFAGVYLIGLNKIGLCDEFHHCCEKDD
ncbi:MAG: nuclear transport factor 2 family protein [bacterium]|nr:nuclear transport factor 2 family protein [bacterium]